MKVRTRDESVTLLNPQPPVARMLDLLHVDELFSTRGRAASETRRHQRGRRLTAGKGDRPPGRFG
jgi:hypothetical protein